MRRDPLVTVVNSLAARVRIMEKAMERMAAKEAEGHHEGEDHEGEGHEGHEARREEHEDHREGEEVDEGHEGHEDHEDKGHEDHEDHEARREDHREGEDEGHEALRGGEDEGHEGHHEGEDEGHEGHEAHREGRLEGEEEGHEAHRAGQHEGEGQEGEGHEGEEGHEEVHGQADGRHRVLLTEVVHILHRYVPEFIPWFRARLYRAGVRVARSPNLRRMMTDFLGRRWSQTTFAPSLIVLNSAFCGYQRPLEADEDVVCDMYFGLLDEHPEWKFEDW